MKLTHDEKYLIVYLSNGIIKFILTHNYTTEYEFTDRPTNHGHMDTIQIENV